jgi:RNA 3'-phosphate cyclase
MLTLDGSAGEGGGQILRSALALSLLTGTPFRIEKIRARRAKPGLLRQHLTAVQAAARIGSAQVEGAELGSRALTVRPGTVAPGEYHFAIGSAGSACLVVQTVLPPLLLASGPSVLIVEGGTHNPAAPSWDFLARVFFPLLERMGARIRTKLERHGFYPAGGGRLRVEIDPVSTLAPLELLKRGEIAERSARVYRATSQTASCAWSATSFRASSTMLTPSPRATLPVRATPCWSSSSASTSTSCSQDTASAACAPRKSRSASCRRCAPTSPPTYPWAPTSPTS